MTILSHDRLETLWDGMKSHSLIPDELRIETEEKLMKNKLAVNVNFCDRRIKEDDLKDRLAEFYNTISLVDPLVKDASLYFKKGVNMIVTDTNGVIISCPSEDIVGYCCPAADITNKNDKLKRLLELGNILEVNYDNGIRSQLVPIFNEQDEIQFYIGVSDRAPISVEASNILYLAAQLVQQRYKYYLMIDQYTRSFMNVIPECVVLLDENARIVNVNDQCLNLLKIDIKNLLKGMHINHLVTSRKPIDNLGSLYSADLDTEFHIQVGGKNIPCNIIDKQLINTPYGKQMVILFNKNKDSVHTAELSSGVLNSTYCSFDKIIGNDPDIIRIKTLARQAAKSSSTILIEGESGTGKELFAEAIHRESQRKGMFISINCGGIPSELIQSELFGYEEGAFTGAKKRGSPGKFELADGGTVFLDEIGEMPVDMQVSLLRFLQDKKITRVGGHIPQKIDVRIIAATNRNLKNEVEKGNFREDLYYRLNVINIQIPPLRKRKGDIPFIANYLLEKQCDQNGIAPLEISKQIMTALIDYDWPGNARELENTVERAFIMREGKELIFDNLPVNSTGEVSSRMEIEKNIDKVKKEAIENCLRVYRGNITQTAKALGMTRQTLYRKMKALNIDRYVFVS